jgi:hypothetical protein
MQDTDDLFLEEVTGLEDGPSSSRSSGGVNPAALAPDLEFLGCLFVEFGSVLFLAVSVDSHG